MTPDDPQTLPRGGLFRRTLRRRWVPILTRWALLTVALWTAAYLLIQGPYRATSVIRVDPLASDLFGVRKGQTEPAGAFMETQVQLITSNNVLTAAATNPKVSLLPRIQTAGDVAQELKKAIKVAVLPTTYLIEVSMDSRSAYESATIVNAVVDAFMDANAEWSDGMTRTQIKNLETYLHELKLQSDELELRWKELVAKGDAGPRAKQANLISPEHGGKIEEKLIENEMKILEAQALVDAIKAGPNPDAKKLEQLTTEIQAARNLEEALKARRMTTGFNARQAATDEVEIALIREQREGLKSMQDEVNRRLEQLKFEVRGESRVRPVDLAVAPGKPRELWYRPWVLLGIPFATFALVFGLFAVVEAWSGPSEVEARIL